MLVQLLRVQTFTPSGVAVPRRTILDVPEGVASELIRRKAAVEFVETATKAVGGEREVSAAGGKRGAGTVKNLRGKRPGNG